MLFPGDDFRTPQGVQDLAVLGKLGAPCEIFRRRYAAIFKESAPEIRRKVEWSPG